MIDTFRKLLICLFLFFNIFFGEYILGCNLVFYTDPLIVTYNFLSPVHPLPSAYRTTLYLPLLAGKNVAFVGNQTSVINNTHIVDTLISCGVKIVKVFSPEHGFRGDAEAGAKVTGGVDVETGLPVVSLYGSHKKPQPDDLKDIEVVLFDIQDVGARFYTYISTLHYMMEACAENNVPLIVLDRPNPNGHIVDGPVLEPGFTSFIGMHPVALIHGMTICEYALMINGEGWLANSILCDLHCIKMENYRHGDIYPLPVNPSPNLQDMDAVYLYPSVCLLEGTVASLGRGTGYPFRLIGHPDIKNWDTIFIPRSIPGKSENPKFRDKACRGWLYSCTRPDGGSCLDSLDLQPLIRIYNEIGNGEKFFTSSFNLLAGNSKLKQQIIDAVTIEDIRESWEPNLSQFKQIRQKYLLYP